MLNQHRGPTKSKVFLSNRVTDDYGMIFDPYIKMDDGTDLANTTLAKHVPDMKYRLPSPQGCDTSDGNPIKSSNYSQFRRKKGPGRLKVHKVQVGWKDFEPFCHKTPPLNLAHNLPFMSAPTPMINDMALALKAMQEAIGVTSEHKLNLDNHQKEPLRWPPVYVTTAWPKSSG